MKRLPGAGSMKIGHAISQTNAPDSNLTGGGDIH